MRLAVLVLATTLSGCTALAAGATADLNRQRRAAATTTAAGLVEHPPETGDVLTVHLTTGETVRDAFSALVPDSLVLVRRTVALAQVDRVVRPWTRREAGNALVLGILADVAVLYLVSRHSGFGYSGFTLN